jgi:hypothetical protein
MHRIVCCALAAVAPMSAACYGIAQNAAAPANSAGRTTQPPQPYTAEFKITTVKTLTDGTTITREVTEILARDSQGRSMRSTTDPIIGGEGATLTHTTVNDPVGGLDSRWDSRTKKAHVTRMPPQDQRHGCWATDSGSFRTSWFQGPQPGKPAPNGTVLSDGSTMVPAQRSRPQVEDLGTTTIQGIEVHGRRMTRTTPAGEMGNDRPIVSVTEYWSSPQLGLTLREITDDPRIGKRTRELTSLTTAEPDPAVFQPPEGYEVTEETLHQVERSRPQ